MKWFEKAFGEWVVRNRWWLLVATVLAALGAASGVRFLTFDNDLRVFFSKENPQLQALEALENTYTKINNILFTIAPRDGNIFSRETLAAIEELTEASWQIPYSSRVVSITNFQHTRAEEDNLIVEDLVADARGMTDEEIAEAREIALNEPRLVNLLVSPSGHVAGINVTILAPGKSMAEVPETANFARDLANEYTRRYPGIDMYLSGGVMFDNAFSEATRDDMKTLMPLMFLVLVIIVGLALRSFTGTLATLVIILLSMLTGLGLAGWLGISLTPASGSAPTIILTLAVADSVHILATVYQQLSLGRERREAVAESLRINLHPVFLTSITTAIGFVTMNFSDAPPFRDLGNIVAMGVTAAFFYSVLLLPPILVLLPIRARKQTGGTDVYCHSCDRLAGFVIRHRNRIFWIMIMAILLLTAGTTRLELNDNFVKYFSKRYDIRRATDFTQENLRGWDIIEYSMESGMPGGIHEPAYLHKVEEFANWYRSQDKVTHVSTLTDTIKSLNKSMHGDDPAYYRIPDQRQLVAQYLLLYEMSLPFGHDLNNSINVNKSATHLIAFLKNTTTREQRAMDEKARQWLRENAPPQMFTYGSGLSIIWAHISERNIHSMLGAAFWALLLISGILIFALQSFRIGLISLIPNLAPAFMSFGVWGILVGRVGLGLSVIVSLTIGIVVDDTIHFLSKYLRGRREHDMGPEEAVRYAFNTVGTAMWVTTVALVSGFSVLTFSGYNMNAQMGLLTAITITLALLLDFFFLPVLLMKSDHSLQKKGE